VQSFAFCSRCRGLRVGWNERYIVHRLRCEEWVSKSSKLLILTVLFAAVVFAFTAPNAFVFSGDQPQIPVETAGFQMPEAPVLDPAVVSMENLLKSYNVDQANRTRVAKAIIATGKKYNVDARLIASIMIVESRANPFAISGKESIGIMQIHVPTWGHAADREGINLFKIEDNIDFGTRILKDYVHQFGLWEGVKRYNGWNANNPDSENSAMDYVTKVQHVYGVVQQQQQPVSTASLAESLQ
jgi:soluble lytic murein transglycosylase-like protein